MLCSGGGSGKTITNGRLAAEETKKTAPSVEVDCPSTVDGGLGDTYGPDHATEDQFITPWAVSVAR